MRAHEFLGERLDEVVEEIELVRGATAVFHPEAYLAGRQTPVFFGSAISNFGVEELLATFTTHAPGPQAREARERQVEPLEEALSGFVFKIQANMDPGHRDRIAFLRLCSGKYTRGMRLYHSRLGKEVRVADALTFMAAEREHAQEAYAGDIIGLHNHGTINIGDTFTRGGEAGLHGGSQLRAGDFPAGGAEGSFEDEGAAEGVVAALRGGGDAAVQAGAEQ